MRSARDVVDDGTDGGPFVTEVDVAGLYEPDVAVLASRTTACDPGSGPTRIDD